MQTIKDVLDRFGRGVLMHRHGDYLMNPEMTHLPKGVGMPVDPRQKAAYNYARMWPDHCNPLSQFGRDVSLAQGQMLAEMDIPLFQIWTSFQGRGPETGLYMSLGYNQVHLGMRVPLIPEPGINYPVYQSPEAVLRGFDEFGEVASAHWMADEAPWLCQESPGEFRSRMLDAVHLAFAAMVRMNSGSILMTTHWENVTWAYCAYVLGHFPTKWQPTKSAGIILAQDDQDAIKGFEYDPEFNIIEG